MQTPENKAAELTVAFIGLGAMGWHMAGHLAKCYPTLVYNRTAAKADAHAKAFGTLPVSLADAMQADVIFSCLPTSDDVLGLLSACQPKANSVWVDNTSGVPAMANTIGQLLLQHGVAYLDAPVSGQTIGAQNGTLTVMVGGDAGVLQRVKPIIACYASHIEHVGQLGAGFATKAVNNMLLAVNLWSACEGLLTLKAAGVDVQAALNCINLASGCSLASENTIPSRILNRSFPLTFALPLLAKDTRIALDLVKHAALSTPVMQLVQDLVARADQQLPAGGDFSSMVLLLEQMNALQVAP